MIDERRTGKNEMAKVKSKCELLVIKISGIQTNKKIKKFAPPPLIPNVKIVKAKTIKVIKIEFSFDNDLFEKNKYQRTVKIETTKKIITAINIASVVLPIAISRIPKLVSVCEIYITTKTKEAKATPII
jgi:hypothetical protein